MLAQRMTRATMTCAGLLGLATGHGARADNLSSRGKAVKVDVSKDAQMRRGLALVGSLVGKPIGPAEKGPTIDSLNAIGGKVYYLFWSMERVALILGLETIGKKDWYQWGAEYLLANQRRDGTWVGEHGDGGSDTCFALLFLRRVNLLRDLSTALQGAKDPGRNLRAGGIGGGALRGGTDRPADTAGAKPKDDIPREAGPRPAVPKKAAPRTAEEKAADALTTDLVTARGEGRAAILKKLRDTRGSAYTEALAGVIPRLEPETRKLAREALADRLTRMKAATLREYLKDTDAEMRRAGAIAAGQKDEKSLVPDLITALGDAEALVQRAAHASLKALSGKDFGPKADADAEDRRRAVAAWRAWWKSQARE
jgi:hypothetical protein